MKLKEYLKLNGITNKDFSKVIGISPVSLSRYISGERVPEKEIVLTTSYDKIDNSVELQVNMSNYSPGVIKNCSLIPEFNSSNLSLVGIAVSYTHLTLPTSPHG